MKRIAIDARMINKTGIGSYVKYLLTYITKYRHENDFCAIIYSNNPGAAGGGLKLIKVKARPFSLAEQFELPLKVTKYGINLFHSPQFNVPIFAKTKQVTTVHDCAFDKLPEEVPSHPAKMYYRLMMNLALKKSVRIIAVSESTKNDLMDYYHVSPKKITVIYNGVDEERFRFFNNKNVMKNVIEKYNLRFPFGLYVGLVRPRKNIENLLKAIRLLKDVMDSSFKFVFAGKADNRFYNLSALIQKLDIADTIVRTGFVSDEELLALYKQAAFLILPSFYEGFGYPVLEAMAAGTPVIASNTSSLPEVAGDAALLVDPYNVAEIADAMYQILTDTDLREKLIKKGYEQVKKFPWERCARKTLQVYEEVLHE